MLCCSSHSSETIFRPDSFQLLNNQNIEQLACGLASNSKLLSARTLCGPVNRPEVASVVISRVVVEQIALDLRVKFVAMILEFLGQIVLEIRCDPLTFR